MAEINDTFGLELLHKLYNTQVVKKEDVLFYLVHWCFIKYGFKCIGLGHSKTFDASEKRSELLPDGWNTQPNYAVRYVKDEKLYILLGTKSDEDFLLNLLRIKDEDVLNIHFSIGETVAELHGPLETVVPSYQTVLNAVHKDIIEPTLVNKSAENSTQTEEAKKHEQVTTRDVPLRDHTRYPDIDAPWPPRVDPRNVGVGDLNPFGRGGGMLFDPFSPSRSDLPNPERNIPGIPGGRLPPGAIPPHSRFIPFGPPEPGPMGGPRPGHPDFDNMFM